MSWKVKLLLAHCTLVFFKAWKRGTDVKNLPPEHPARQLHVWTKLSLMEDTLLVVDNQWIFVPKACWRKILALLHEGHSGITKNYTTAWERYYWPNLWVDVANVINKCDSCQTHWPSLVKDDKFKSSASYPMEKVAVDLFQHRSTHYLALVDRYLGYPWFHPLKQLLSDAVFDKLNGWFLQFGYPSSIHSNGRPQFCSAFKEFCKANGIQHEVASPYNLKSNGLVEVNICSLKQILDKVRKLTFESAFSSWKNMKRVNRPSPNMLFFGRKLHLKLPELLMSFPISVDNHNTSATYIITSLT